MNLFKVWMDLMNRSTSAVKTGVYIVQIYLKNTHHINFIF